MEALPRINWLDLAIILTLIGGMVVGFAQGVLRQTLWLAAVYVSIVVAAQYHPLLAYYLSQLSPQMLLTMAQVLAFVILLFVSGVVFVLIGMDVLRHATDRPVNVLSHLGGGLLGLVSAAVFVSVGLVVLGFMTVTAWPGAGEAVREWLARARERSDLASVFRMVFSAVLQTMRPWLPNLPPIFTIDFPNHAN